MNVIWKTDIEIGCDIEKISERMDSWKNNSQEAFQK